MDYDEDGSTHSNFRGSPVSMDPLAREECIVWPLGPVPFQSELFAVRFGGDTKSWRMGGDLAGRQTTWPLSPVGRVRRRSCSAELAAFFRIQQSAGAGKRPSALI